MFWTSINAVIIGSEVKGQGGGIVPEIPNMWKGGRRSDLPLFIEFAVRALGLGPIGPSC